MSLVKAMKTAADFKSYLASAPPTKLVVVDFSATWCGPCKAIKPVVNELSTKFRHVGFLEVDVDQNQETAAAQGVSAMPTFQLFKAGVKIGELKGANPAGLEQLVKQYQGPADGEGSAVVGGVLGHSDLSEFIAVKQVHCLNQATDHTVQNIFKKDASYLESDVDEQLIISIEFNQTVKLHSLKIAAPKGFAPKTIRTFINKVTLGFEDAESIECTETLTLTEKDVTDEAAIIPLRFVRYQHVTKLLLFVENNLGGEETTRIQHLTLIGSPLEQTKDLAELKKNDHGPS